MKKLFVLLLSAILCMQFASCDALVDSLNKADKTDDSNQPTIETAKPSHVFSTADGCTLEIALTQGQEGNPSSSSDLWRHKLDVSDQSVYGNALSNLKPAKLISENGKLNPSKWLESSASFIYSDSGSINMAIGKALDSAGTYTDGAYQVNDSYGIRAVGISTDKGIEVHACIVDLAFRSTDGGTLSFCTGENGSTLKNIISALAGGTITNSTVSPKATTSDGTVNYVLFDSSKLRLVFFDTETLEILGMATTRSTSSGSFATSGSASGSSSSVIVGSINSNVTFVALDENGNEVEGNLNLCELLPGETRHVSVLLFKEHQSGANVSGDKDKEDGKDNGKDESAEKDNDSCVSIEPETNESSDTQGKGDDSSISTEAEINENGEIKEKDNDSYVYIEVGTNENGALVYDGKYELVTGSVSVNIEHETFKIQVGTYYSASTDYSFNLMFTDK